MPLSLFNALQVSLTVNPECLFFLYEKKNKKTTPKFHLNSPLPVSQGHVKHGFINVASLHPC